MQTKNWFGSVYGWAQAVAFGSLLVGILIESRSAMADEFDPLDGAATAVPPDALTMYVATPPSSLESEVPSQILSPQPASAQRPAAQSPVSQNPPDGSRSGGLAGPAVKNIDAYMIPPRAGPAADAAIEPTIEPVIALGEQFFCPPTVHKSGFFTGGGWPHRSIVFRTYQSLIRLFGNPLGEGRQNHRSPNDWTNRLNLDDNLSPSDRSIWKLDAANALDDENSEDRADGTPSLAQTSDAIDRAFSLVGPEGLETAAVEGNSSGRDDGWDDGNDSSGEIREMLFEDISYAPAYTRDAVYSDAFLDSGRVTSTAQLADDGTGGHLGVLLTEHPIDPDATAPNSRAQQNVSAALGYQRFLDARQRQQIILEVGGRSLTYGTETRGGAVGVRYQQALGDHLSLRLDTFGALNEARGIGCGGRLEFRVEF